MRAGFEIKDSLNPLSDHNNFTYYNIDLLKDLERASQKSINSDEPLILGKMYVGILKDKTGLKKFWTLSYQKSIMVRSYFIVQLVKTGLALLPY